MSNLQIPMKVKIKYSIISFLLVLFNTNFINAQSETTSGNEFWFAYMESGPNSGDQYSIYISSFEDGIAHLSTPASDFEVEVPYQSNSVTEITLPDSIWHPTEYGTITNLGFRLKSSTDITAHTSHLQIFQSETSILYPIGIIGTEYIITTVSQGNFTYIIVGTKDSTNVNINNSGVTTNIQIDAGETYQVFSNVDVSGSYIQANNKIAILSGTRMTKMCGSEGGSNHLFEQQLPLNQLGSKYVLVPFADQGPTLIKVLATTDNTELILNNSTITNLDSQESFEFSFEVPSILESTENIQLSQIACHYDSIGDPSLLHLIPTDRIIYEIYIPSIPGFGSMPETFSKRYLNLITQTQNIDDILIDNEIIDAQFKQIPSDPSYSYAQIEIDGNSNHILASKGVHGYSYGFGNLDAYTFSIGFEKEKVTSIKNEYTNECKFYPNPVQDKLFLNCRESLNIEIFNQVGQLVLKVDSIDSNSFDLSDLPPGIYFLKFQKYTGEKETNIIRRIIKN